MQSMEEEHRCSGRGRVMIEECDVKVFMPGAALHLPNLHDCLGVYVCAVSEHPSGDLINARTLPLILHPAFLVLYNFWTASLEG